MYVYPLRQCPYYSALQLAGTRLSRVIKPPEIPVVTQVTSEREREGWAHHLLNLLGSSLILPAYDVLSIVQAGPSPFAALRLPLNLSNSWEVKSATFIYHCPMETDTRLPISTVNGRLTITLWYLFTLTRAVSRIRITASAQTFRYLYFQCRNTKNATILLHPLKSNFAKSYTEFQTEKIKQVHTSFHLLFSDLKNIDSFQSYQV